MKQINIMILTFLAVCFFWIGKTSTAAATTEISTDKLDIVHQMKSVSRQPITNIPIELTGSQQDANFYYELTEDTSGKNNQLVLNITYSELLISPSSLTISIDGEAIMSKPINGKNQEKIVVPLTDRFLKKGVHTVNIAFSGVIKEGVCINQNTSGNWLTIGIDSYLQFNRQLNKQAPTLMDYPNEFIGTADQPVYIVLPESASMDTLNSGYMLATYLAKQSEFEESVKVIRESQVKKISEMLW